MKFITDEMFDNMTEKEFLVWVLALDIVDGSIENELMRRGNSSIKELWRENLQDRNQLEWYCRYYLVLPCRSEDEASILKHFPELLQERAEGEVVYISPFGIRLDQAELSRWVESGKSEESETEPMKGQAEQCPAADCPIRGTVSIRGSAQDLVCHFIVMNKGSGDKPLDSFIEMVKEHHSSRAGEIQSVVLTDPYYYSNGSRFAVKYLEALGLNQDSEFLLRVNGSPKGNVGQSPESFKLNLKGAFPKIRIKEFTGLTFHDRLYLVKLMDDTVSGVFGPSLNGLDSEAIVLVGTLEENNLDTISEIEGLFSDPPPRV